VLPYHCMHRRWLGYKGNILSSLFLASRANGFSYKAKFRKGIDRRNKETEINIALIPSFSSIGQICPWSWGVGKVLKKNPLSLEGWNSLEKELVVVKQVSQLLIQSWDLSCNKSFIGSSSYFRYIIFSSQPLWNNGQASPYFRLVVILP
jgi:hypothetical protein